MDCTEAAKYFKEKGIKPQFLYLDATHTYKSVMKELEAWYPIILENDGIITGDDFDWKHKEVGKAVKDFAAKHGLKYYTDKTFWVMGIYFS